MQEKLVPQNIEAEQNVLSAILIENKSITTVVGILKPEDFYRISHQLIYRAMLDLYAKHTPIDMVTVTDALKTADKLNDVGGVSYITLLANVAPTAANIKYHARIVAQKAALRKMVESGTAIAAMGYEGNGDNIRQLIDEAEKSLLRLTYRRSTPDCVPIHDILSTNVDRICSLVENRKAVTGLSTGFADLDYITAGLHPSDFIILAARPSMGKTALALNIAENIALRGAKDGENPKSVAFFSLEMDHDQLVQRMIYNEADIDTNELRPQKDLTGQESGNSTGGEPTEEEKEELLDRVWTTAEKLDNANIFIDDTPGLTIMEMRSKARRMQAEHGLDLIVIDYLQLMQASDGSHSENRQREVSEISRGLKSLARELNVPVLALSQLSRSVEYRQVKKPMLSDLRESGSLEQDADIVMFLYREDYYKNNDETPSHLTELIIAKHRNGPTGKIKLFFKDDCTKFLSLNEADA